jgi:hypothetical protein
MVVEEETCGPSPDFWVVGACGDLSVVRPSAVGMVFCFVLFLIFKFGFGYGLLGGW